MQTPIAPPPEPTSPAVRAELHELWLDYLEGRLAPARYDALVEELLDLVGFQPLVASD